MSLNPTISLFSLLLFILNYGVTFISLHFPVLIPFIYLFNIIFCFIFGFSNFLLCSVRFSLQSVVYALDTAFFPLLFSVSHLYLLYSVLSIRLLLLLYVMLIIYFLNALPSLLNVSFYTPHFY